MYDCRDVDCLLMTAVLGRYLSNSGVEIDVSCPSDGLDINL